MDLLFFVLFGLSVGALFIAGIYSEVVEHDED